MADIAGAADAYGEQEHIPGAFESEPQYQDPYPSQHPPPSQSLPEPPSQQPAKEAPVIMSDSATPIGIANVR